MFARIRQSYFFDYANGLPFSTESMRGFRARILRRWVCVPISSVSTRVTSRTCLVQLLLPAAKMRVMTILSLETICSLGAAQSACPHRLSPDTRMTLLLSQDPQFQVQSVVAPSEQPGIIQTQYRIQDQSESRLINQYSKRTHKL